MSEPDGIVGLIGFIGFNRPFCTQPARQHKSDDDEDCTEQDTNDFASDTIDRDDPESHLDTVDVGDHTLWLIHGPEAMLACAIRGVPPAQLRGDFQEVLAGGPLIISKVRPL